MKILNVFAGNGSGSSEPSTRMERNRQLREETRGLMRRDAQRVLGRGNTQNGRPRRIPRNQQLRMDI